MVDFHDPRADTGVEKIPYALGLDLDAGITVGFLANGFPDSENFLNEISTALAELVPGIKLRHWNKGNASVPANDDMLAAIEEECDVAIAAYGH